MDAMFTEIFDALHGRYDHVRKIFESNLHREVDSEKLRSTPHDRVRNCVISCRMCRRTIREGEEWYSADNRCRNHKLCLECAIYSNARFGITECPCRLYTYSCSI